MAALNGGYASIVGWCNGIGGFEGGNRGANGAKGGCENVWNGGGIADGGVSGEKGCGNAEVCGAMGERAGAWVRVAGGVEVVVGAGAGAGAPGTA